MIAYNPARHKASAPQTRPTANLPFCPANAASSSGIADRNGPRSSSNAIWLAAAAPEAANSSKGNGERLLCSTEQTQQTFCSEKFCRCRNPSAACSECLVKCLPHTKSRTPLHYLQADCEHAGKHAPAQPPEPAAARQRHRRRNAQRAQAPCAHLPRRQLIPQE